MVDCNTVWLLILSPLIAFAHHGEAVGYALGGGADDGDLSRHAGSHGLVDLDAALARRLDFLDHLAAAAEEVAHHA